jgi:DNA-binding protein HU-beta
MSKKTLGKGDVIDALSKDLDGASKKQVGEFVDAFIELVTKTVAKGGEVSFTGFGKFGSSKRAARNGRNPATGATIKIPAAVVPKFSAGKAFKDAVNKKK